MIAAVALFSASASSAQTVNPESAYWSVAPAFSKSDDARTNISGAACASAQSCLAVNDQKKYAQFFSISGNKIVPGALVGLLPDGADGDPDGEGAAYDTGYFYVIGSHGLSRKKGKFEKESFLVFRFKRGGAVEKSARLREAMRAAQPIAPFAEKPLNANGANIEGIAVAGGRLYAGFRGPSIDGRAFILDAAVDGIFGIAPLDTKVHALALGAGRGIRDLARVDDGVLVLAGPVTEGGGGPSVFHWNAAGALKKIADLGGTLPGAKAETLLLLEQQPQRYRVLVMFDGPANGQPTEYLLPRP